nr:rod shape-determining protein MreD [Desulfurispira natronophila]
MIFLLLLAAQSLLPSYFAMPSLPYIYFFCLIALLGEWDSILLGLLLGLIMDSMAATVTGFHMLTYATTAYLVVAFRQRQIWCQKYELAVLLMICVALQGLMQVYLINAANLPVSALSPAMEYRIFFQIFLETFFAGALFWVFRTPVQALHTKLDSLYERRNTRRKRRPSWREDDIQW